MNTQRLAKLKEYLEQDSQDPFLKYAIAQEYDRGSLTDDALRWYQKVQNEHPDYVANYYHYGKLLEKSGDPTLALSVFATGMKKAELAGDRHALAELKEAYIQAGGEDDEDW
jgi:hypothetical protein